MLLAVGKTTEVFSAAGKPADFLLCIFSTEITFGGSNLPILHQFPFGREFLRDKLGISVKDNGYLFLSAGRCAEVVDGLKFKNLFVWKNLQNLSCIVSV